MNNVESAVDLDVLVKFSLRILIIFALIFLLAVLTPKLARIIDGWIKRYRENHTREETYGIRSIYELPPAPEDGEEEYDLGTEYDESDGEEYVLDDEPGEMPLAQILTEPVYLFSYWKLDEEPFDFSRRAVKLGRKFVPDIEPMDLSGVAFGMKNRPAMYEPVPDDDEDDEFLAEHPPVQYAPFEEHFFDDEPEEPAQVPSEDDDLPWFMR